MHDFFCFHGIKNALKTKKKMLYVLYMNIFKSLFIKVLQREKKTFATTIVNFRNLNHIILHKTHISILYRSISINSKRKIIILN